MPDRIAPLEVVHGIGVGPLLQHAGRRLQLAPTGNRRRRAEDEVLGHVRLRVASMETREDEGPPQRIGPGEDLGAEGGQVQGAQRRARAGVAALRVPRGA